ncbi:MAG TPA: hypothetical protein VNZ53_45690 [Steroidobacteraceae bacterium]|nr:hypothetical protein [Steroidobacteraceae bacterium]
MLAAARWELSTGTPAACSSEYRGSLRNKKSFSWRRNCRMSLFALRMAVAKFWDRSCVPQNFHSSSEMMAVTATSAANPDIETVTVLRIRCAMDVLLSLPAFMMIVLLIKPVNRP